MADRKRNSQPPYDDHLGEARRSGRAYSPVYTHSDIDALLKGLVTYISGPPENAPGQPKPPKVHGQNNTTPCAVDATTIIVTPTVNGDDLIADVEWVAHTCRAAVIH